MLIIRIIRYLFGKDTTPAWRNFALENGGTYHAIPDHKVSVNYKGFTIIFDAYTYYTTAGHSSSRAALIRGFVQFNNPGHYNLLITQQGIIENISKLFGAQDIRIGDKEFDKTFMIKSNDELKTQLLLTNSIIRDTLLKYKTIRFTITNEDGLWNERPAEGKYMLYFVMETKITRKAQLQELLSLYKETIDYLSFSYSTKL